MSDKNIHQKINISLPASIMSLDDKKNDDVDRNTGDPVNSLHEVTQLG